MKRRRLLSEINVVPYVDVMLVLLVIFMIAAPMLTQGVQVNLPQSQSQPVQPRSKPLILSVNAQGQTFVADRLVAPAVLTQAVQAAREAAPDLQVLVRGDRDARYGQVIALMAALQRAGVHDVGLLTEDQARR